MRVCLQRPASSKNTEPSKEALLRLRKQVIAPIEELVSAGDSLPPSVSRGKMLFAAANFHHEPANFDLARRLGERLLLEAITVKDGQLAR